MAGVRKVPEGQFTQTIYKLIKEQRFEEVVNVLSDQLLQTPNSRAAMSLLAFSYYQMQDFQSAAAIYKDLVTVILTLIGNLEYIGSCNCILFIYLFTVSP